MHPTLQLKHYSFMLFSSRCNPFSVLLLFLFQGVLMQLRPSKVRGHLLWPLAFWVSPSDFTAEPTTTLAILQKQGDSTAHEMLRPYHVPRSTGSDRDRAPRPQALKSTATPYSWFHSYTAEPSTNCLKYPFPQARAKQGSTCFSRSWVFLLWHSNLGAVRQALRLVWSSLLQALHFTLMLSASKSNTLQAKEFFICFSYMRSSQLSVPDTLIVFCQSSFQLRSAPSFLPNFASMLHKV